MIGSKRFVRLRRPATLVFAACLSTASADVPKPDCQCRLPDSTLRDIGTVVCMKVAATHYLMRCEMSTNTPYWKRLLDDEGCPTA